MLAMADVKPADVVYDLQCGDGSTLIAVAKISGAKAVGVQGNAKLLQQCQAKAKKAGIGDKVQFIAGPLEQVDIKPASVILLHDFANSPALKNKLLNDLQPGSRVVAIDCLLEDWSPDLTVQVEDLTLHGWVVPAKVAGSWACKVGRNQNAVIRLEQKNQQVRGTVTVGEEKYALRNVSLIGTQLSFTVPSIGFNSPAIRYTCHVKGKLLQGMAEQVSDPDVKEGMTML